MGKQKATFHSLSEVNERLDDFALGDRSSYGVMSGLLITFHASRLVHCCAWKPGVVGGSVFATFNHHLWSAGIVLAPFLLTAFGYVLYQFKGKADWYHFFDSRHNKHPALKAEGGTFETHWSHYEGIAKLSITLSAGAIAFMINALVSDATVKSNFGPRILDVAPIVIGLFGSSIFLLVCFLAWMAYCYEDYCHQSGHDSYSAWKYATTISLGFNGFLAFIFAFVWLGVNLFW
jgi:hypothetical protein